MTNNTQFSVRVTCMSLSVDASLITINVSDHHLLYIYYDGDRIRRIEWSGGEEITITDFYAMLDDWAAKLSTRSANLLRTFIE